MLTARGVHASRGATAVFALALVGWSAAASVPAYGAGASGGGSGGGGTVTTCQNDWVCSVASSPGSPGGTGSGSGGGGSSSGGSSSNTCSYNGKQEPCYIANVGYLDSADGCYYEQAQPQPPAGDIAWGGHQPGDGAVYTRTCPDQVGTGATDVWLAQAPAAAAPTITPEQLAREMVSRLHLTSATVQTAPAGKALVGENIWLWAARNGTTFPDAANPLVVPPATAGGFTVTAEVWVSRIVWDMGDGSTADCSGPGTPYTSSQTATASPDCGYQYQVPSSGQPNQQYQITATTYWTVSWQVNGGAAQTFTLDPMTGQAGVLRVTELQVLN